MTYMRDSKLAPRPWPATCIDELRNQSDGRHGSRGLATGGGLSHRIEELGPTPRRNPQRPKSGVEPMSRPALVPEKRMERRPERPVVGRGDRSDHVGIWDVELS